MTRSFFLAAVTFCVLLVGCDEAAMMKKHVPLKDEPVARKYLELLLVGNIDQIEKDLDPTIVDLDPREELRQLADMLPAEVPSDVKVVGAQAFEAAGVSKRDFTYECEFQEMWFLVSVSLQKKDNVWTVLGIRGNRLSDSLENLNRFTFLGKGLSQYFTLLSAVCSLALSFYALWLCFRTKTGPTPWIWVPFILAGVGQFSVNWTTGELFLQIWAIRTPCASATTALYSPWIIGVSLPMGALMFLNERWRENVQGESDSDHDIQLAWDSLRRK
jgi:hypothetical protein